MKSIIENKLYDTSKSTVLYMEGSSCLWKTVNGSYFMTDGSGIKVMTSEEVKEYLGTKDVDSYISEFGTVEEA